MENVRLIIDIVFKVAVIFNMLVTAFTINNLQVSLNELWALVVKQAGYLSDVQKELEELKEKKTKKKTQKKEDKHE